MATIKKYKPGEFCWADLGTTDAAGAKKFYHGLFGCEAWDMPMGDEDQKYSMLRIKGKEVCALYSREPERRKTKTPPFWLPYLSVANVDRTIKKATAAGAVLCMGPNDVPKAGRMAILQDPTGAAFAVWQARGNIGTKVKGVHGAVGWHDLNTPNRAAAGKFYTKVFGWKMETLDFSGNPYHLFRLGRKDVCGMWPHTLPNHPSAWFTYWIVDNCAKAVAKVKRLGGKVVMGPITVPDASTFAILKDPQGAAFGALEPMMSLSKRLRQHRA